jgi:hypothetical protein
MYTVAVSYLEWIRWVATGWFRCADRVVWVEGAEDQSGIDALLDRTPDLQVSDDQGYVIACLRTDSLISDRVSGRDRSLGRLWLSVAAVSSFHPLSIRGARLLEADAERAAVRLGEPLFEKAWADWRDRRLEDEAHWRGLSLCAAFGLDKPLLNETSNQVDDILAGRKAAPNAADVREKAIDGTRALGWASAMSIAVMDSDVRAAFNETPEFVAIKSLIKTHRNDFDLRRPLLDDETTVTFVRGVDGVLQKLGARVLPLDLMATVLHYRSLATGGRQLTLEALVDDLVAIALKDPHHASVAAYFIGRSMENVAVSTLLYQSEPARYAALAPAAGRTQLSVMSRAARRLEARQPVDEVQKANPGGGADANTAKESIDATSGAAAQAEVEQPASGELAVVDGSNLIPGDSSAIAVSAPVPPGDSSVAGLPTVLLFGVAEPQEGVNSAPSAGIGEELIQPERSSTQPLAELFPQTTDGLDPIAASTKSKKKRKKSDKSPEVRSAVETSDDTSDK